MAQPCLMDVHCVICWCGILPGSKGRVPQALLPYCLGLFGPDGATYTVAQDTDGWLCPASCKLSGLMLCAIPADMPNHLSEDHGSKADRT